VTPPTRPCDTIAPLLPWHANGTLGADERAAVVEHLAGCADCRALSAPATAFRALAERVPRGRLLDHVQAQLLVEFVEAPETLGDEPRAWVAGHLAACDICGEAAEILRDMGALPAAVLEGASPGRAAAAESVRDGGPRSALARLWDRLSISVLRPLPALVYLVVALLALPGLRRTFAPEPPPQTPPVETPSDPGPAATAPPVVLSPPQRIRAAIEMRGGGQAAPGPALIRVAPGRPLLLEIDPDLDREDRIGSDAGFAIELHVDDASSLTLPCRTDDLDAHGRLRIVVPAGLVQPGATGTIVLRLRRPGQARDGEVLFERALLFAASQGGGP